VNRNGVDAYRQTDVMTAAPKRLVIMCYEGAISNLNLAKKKYLSGEYEAKAKAIQKVQDIMSELMAALDLGKGGQIAENLEGLYSYMLRRITEGDLKKDITAIDEVTGMLEELKGTWEEIFYGNNKDLPGSVTPRVSNQSANQDTYGPLGTL
jgi:flagellar protein FliS